MPDDSLHDMMMDNLIKDYSFDNYMDDDEWEDNCFDDWDDDEWDDWDDSDANEDLDEE